MKRIGIDLRILTGKSNYSGIERYSFNVALELTKIITEDYFCIGEIIDKEFLSAKHIRLDLPRSNSSTAIKLLALKGYLENLDLLFSPYFPIPQRRTFKGVMTIHDLIPLRYPELFSNSRAVHEFFNNAIRESAVGCNHIIADSQATKNDIMEFFSIDGNKISVVPLASSFDLSKNETNLKNEQEVLKNYNINTPYILSVCTIEPRKNLSRVLKAYEVIRKRIKEQVKLVLVGGLGWKYHELTKEINENRYSTDIILPGYVSDQDLPIIYKNAEVFVFPSLYEGFGLPVLEAMSMGAPVVTSNTSSLPEVSGEAAVYCNPLDIDAITEAIEKVLCNQDKRAKLIKLGKERAKLFSWEKTAVLTREVFLKVLSE